MHQFLRAIGFSDITKKQLNEVINNIIDKPEKLKVTKDSEGNEFAELSCDVAPNMGITVRGIYNDDDSFDIDYYYPYFTGSEKTTNEIIDIEKHSEKESYAGVCDDPNLGVTLIFYLQNVSEYLNKQRYGRADSFSASVILSGLSVEGKILMPVYQKTPVVSEIKSSQERSKMIQAARNGDEEAIENLTLEDMDTYSMISKRIADEDVFSIVTTHFMPCGVECDHYNIMGDILDVELRENNKTGEKIYVMTIESNSIVLDVCINEQDLLGVPERGRRFRGIIWLQGLVHFEEKW